MYTNPEKYHLEKDPIPNLNLENDKEKEQPKQAKVIEVRIQFQKPDFQYEPDYFQIIPTEDFENYIATDQPRIVSPEEDPTIQLDVQQSMKKSLLNAQDQYFNELDNLNQEDIKGSQVLINQSITNSDQLALNEDDIIKEMATSYNPSEPIPYDSS